MTINLPTNQPVSVFYQHYLQLRCFALLFCCTLSSIGCMLFATVFIAIKELLLNHIERVQYCDWLTGTVFAWLRLRAPVETSTGFFIVSRNIHPYDVFAAIFSYGITNSLYPTEKFQKRYWHRLEIAWNLLKVVDNLSLNSLVIYYCPIVFGVA